MRVFKLRCQLIHIGEGIFILELITVVRLSKIWILYVTNHILSLDLFLFQHLDDPLTLLRCANIMQISIVGYLELTLVYGYLACSLYVDVSYFDLLYFLVLLWQLIALILILDGTCH